MAPYRPPEDAADGRARDPLAAARARLAAEGLADAADLDRIDAAAAVEMDMALEAAVAAAPPGLPTMFQDVYAPGTPAPRPQADRLRAILSEAPR
jgi:pyruvate dehydrogenase E1 component alpha subunit